MGRLSAFVVVLIVLAVPARAQFVQDRIEHGSGWHVAYGKYLNVAGQPRACLIFDDGGPNSPSLSIHYEQDLVDSATPKIWFSLSQPNWEIAEGARGKITLTAGPVSQMLEFVRGSPTFMSAAPPKSPENGKLADAILTNETLLTLPNGQALRATPPDQEFQLKIFQCLIGLLPADAPAPAPSNDPFANPRR